jgi:hypothetical protein
MAAKNIYQAYLQLDLTFSSGDELLSKRLGGNYFAINHVFMTNTSNTSVCLKLILEHTVEPRLFLLIGTEGR